MRQLRIESFKKESQITRTFKFFVIFVRFTIGKLYKDTYDLISLCMILFSETPEKKETLFIKIQKPGRINFSALHSRFLTIIFFYIVKIVP